MSAANPTSIAEFEAAYAARAGVTVEELHRWGRFGQPCDCGDEICTGWVMGHQWEDAIFEDQLRAAHSSYVQGYDDASGDAVVNPLPGTGVFWWWCEHEGPNGEEHHAVLEAREGGRADCPDCGTGWIVWSYGGRHLAKPIVVRIS